MHDALMKGFINDDITNEGHWRFGKLNFVGLY